MAENTGKPGSTATEPAQAAGPQQGGAEFAPITTQADLDKVISQRLARERAKYQDFEAYKASHEELERLKEADKTEQQRLKERAEAAETALKALKEKAEAEAWRKEVAAATGVPEAAIFGATREEMEAKAAELKPYFEHPATPHVPGQGAAPAKGAQGGDPLRALIDNRR